MNILLLSFSLQSLSAPDQWFGADKARHQAQALAEQAVGHLAGHGEEADILRALARFMVERDR